MNQTLKLVGVDDIHIVLGHVGIFRALVCEAKLGKTTGADTEHISKAVTVFYGKIIPCENNPRVVQGGCAGVVQQTKFTGTSF